MSLSQVPRDVLPNIIARLDGPALYNFSLTCRAFSEAVYKTPTPLIDPDTLAYMVKYNQIDGVRGALKARAVVEFFHLTEATRADVELMDLLLATGVDASRKVEFFSYPLGDMHLDLLAMAVRSMDRDNKNLAMISHLLQLFPASSAAISVAASENHVEALKLLLAAPNRETVHDISYLIYICQDHPEIVQLLIEDNRLRVTGEEIVLYFNENNEAVPAWIVPKY